MMGDKKVLLQSNHGVTVAAESMDLAFSYMVSLVVFAYMLDLISKVRPAALMQPTHVC